MRLSAAILAWVTIAMLSPLVGNLSAQGSSSGGDDPSLHRAAILDSIYGAWMAPDSSGHRTYWFRKSFDLDEKPTGGTVYVASDAHYGVFVNGSFVGEGGQDSSAWGSASSFPALNFLKVGRNVIAVQAIGVPTGNRGIKLALEYETIPDLDKQLEQMAQRESDQQQQRRQQMAEGVTKETAPAVDDATAQRKIREMRIIEKNKLY